MAFEAPSTLANNQQIMKEVYGGVNMIARQRRKSYDLFTQSKKNITGKYWMTAEHMSGGQGSVGTRPDNVELPPGQPEVYLNGKVYDRYHYAGFQYTGPVLAHAKGDVGSFVNLITSEVTNKTAWLIDDLNMQMYMDGWGVLGKVSANGAFGSGVKSITLSAVGNPLWLRKGVRFDVYTDPAVADATSWKTGAAPTKKNAAGTRRGMQIVSWNPTTMILTATTSTGADVTVAATDVLVLEDLMGAAGLTSGNGVSRESDVAGGEGGGLSGLPVMVDDGTTALSYQSIDRVANPEYAATVLSNGGTARALTLDNLQKLEDLIMINGGGSIDTMLSGHGQRRNLLALGLPDVRHVSEKLALGFEQLTFNGRPWVVDEICNPGVVYFLRRNGNVHKYQSREMSPLDDGTAPSSQRVVGFDLYERYIATYFNVGCDEPNDNGKMIDLVEPA